MGRKDYGDKNTKLRGAGKVAKRQAGFDKTGKLEFVELQVSLRIRDPRTANRFQMVRDLHRPGPRFLDFFLACVRPVLTRQAWFVFIEVTLFPTVQSNK